MTKTTLILASGSRYKEQLLNRLYPNFDTVAADIDETLNSNETPLSGAIRLARAKARRVSEIRPNSVVIGCDQLADLDKKALGKPHTLERAILQLNECSSKRVDFHTAIAVINNKTKTLQEAVCTTSVYFRALKSQQIRYYLEQEQPFDCAGSFKAEALGIALFERIESDDPSSLLGLPLIKLRELLEQEGFDPLSKPSMQ